MAEPVTSTQPLPPPVKTPEVLNPEVVPGGIIDGAQWRHAQDAIKALGTTINLLIAYIGNQTVPTPPPPGWAGIALWATNSGSYNLLPDHNLISVMAPAGTGSSPGSPTDWHFFLPRGEDSNGPITFFSFDNRIYRVEAQPGDEIININYQATTFTNVTFVDEGITGTGTNACWAVYARDHGIPSRWIRTRVNVLGLN